MVFDEPERVREEAVWSTSISTIQSFSWRDWRKLRNKGRLVPRLLFTVAARSRHEPSSPARTLGSWVRMPLEEWMSVCVYSVFVLSCVGSDLATGWTSVQGVLPTVYMIKGLKNRSGQMGCRAIYKVSVPAEVITLHFPNARRECHRSSQHLYCKRRERYRLSQLSLLYKDEVFPRESTVSTIGVSVTARATISAVQGGSVTAWANFLYYTRTKCFRLSQLSLQ
jgi:hypothetical protein